MKKIMILILLGVLLTGCKEDTATVDQKAKVVVYNGVTHGYSLEDAIANGDVVQDSGVTMNISHLYDFMSLLDEGKEASIIITLFLTESVPIINTLEYKNSKFEYTAYQQKTIIYDDLSIDETSEHTEYVLTNGEDTIVILRISNDDI